MDYKKLRAKLDISISGTPVKAGEVFEIPAGTNYRFLTASGMTEPAPDEAVVCIGRRFDPDRATSPDVAAPASADSATPASQPAENRRQDPHEEVRPIEAR